MFSGKSSLVVRCQMHFPSNLVAFSFASFSFSSSLLQTISCLFFPFSLFALNIFINILNHNYSCLWVSEVFEGFLLLIVILYLFSNVYGNDLILKNILGWQESSTFLLREMKNKHTTCNTVYSLSNKNNTHLSCQVILLKFQVIYKPFQRNLSFLFPKFRSPRRTKMWW